MKKPLTLITVLTLAASVTLAQQIKPEVKTVIEIPAVAWTNAAAGNIAAQLAAITNLDGSFVVPAGALAMKSSTIVIHVTVTTNGVEKITAKVN